MNVERIGRYLQVFHEESAGWEHVIASYSTRFPRGPDPLFGLLFVITVSINFLPAALGGDVPEVIVLAVLHLLFVNRVRVAGLAAAKLRAEDLERFRVLKNGGAL